MERGSVKSRVLSLKCGAWNVECKKGSVKRWSVEWNRKCTAGSVVWSENCEMH